MGDVLSRMGSRGFSLEINPPTIKEEGTRIGKHMVDLVEYRAQKLEQMFTYGPSMITCTYHQDKFEKTILEDGRVILDPQKKFIGSDQTVEVLSKHYDFPLIPHFICGGFSIEETRAALEHAVQYSAGFLVVQGDPNHDKRFEPHPEGYRYASELVADAAKLKSVKNIDIFVAGYPEGFYASANADEDVENLQRKEDMGATAVITQLCFDAELIARYRDTLDRRGIALEVIPGLKVFDAPHQLRSIPAVFNAKIPSALRNAALQGDPAVGRDWAIQEAQQLYSEGFTNIHWYSQNKPRSLLPVLEGLGFRA